MGKVADEGNLLTRSYNEWTEDRSQNLGELSYNSKAGR